MNGTMKLHSLKYLFQVKMKLPSVCPSPEVEVLDSSAKAPSIPGVFVLYNYARISSILKKHDKLVQQGEDGSLFQG